MEQHSFNKKISGLSYLVCSKCGLINLRNPFTLWCIQRGCDYEEAPGYENERRKVRDYVK